MSVPPGAMAACHRACTAASSLPASAIIRSISSGSTRSDRPSLHMSQALGSAASSRPTWGTIDPPELPPRDWVMKLVVTGRPSSEGGRAGESSSESWRRWRPSRR